MRDKVKKNDYYFHLSHGLCRISSISKSAETRENQYTLLPASVDKGKIRFVVPEKSLGISGFNKLMSASQGNSILDFFKTGKKTSSDDSQSWSLAMTIRTESAGTESMKNMRKRQQVESAVKGLTGELAYVLKKSMKEIADIIQKNLGKTSEINPLVLTALANVEKE